MRAAVPRLLSVSLSVLGGAEEDDGGAGAVALRTREARWVVSGGAEADVGALRVAFAARAAAATCAIAEERRWQGGR